MLSELPYAFGKPSALGRIKNSPLDFCVSEALSFELTGEGEHLFLLDRSADLEQNSGKIRAIPGLLV